MDDRISAIQEVAIKVKLNVSCWPAKKEDKEATKATHLQQGAKQDAGTYRKNMVSKKHLKPIRDIETEARKFHREVTLPWGQDGERVLPASMVDEYTAEMRRLHQDFDLAVAEFKQKYPAIVIDEKSTLGSMYNQSEYPSLRELEDKFDFRVSITPIESADDFRIKLSESIIDRIKDDVRRQENENQLNITTDLYNRLQNVIEDMIGRLTATKKDKKTGETIYKSFSYTALTNITDLAALLPKLNINNNYGLSELHKEIMDKLGKISVEDIRESEAVREVTVQKGQELLDDIGQKMSFYTGPVEQNQKEAA